MTDYYVYVNDVHNKAIVHAGSCSYCNDGRGMHAVSDSERRVDEWRGPFNTADLAVAEARSTGKRTVARCGTCGKR